MNPLIHMLSEEESVRRGRELGFDDYVSKMHLFRVLLHHPMVAKELNSTVMALVSGQRSLTDREREIIVMRVAWLTRCRYEWGQHWIVSVFFGIDENELAEICNWESASCFNSHERTLLAVTDSVLGMKGLSKELSNQLKLHYPQEIQQVEILSCIGNWHMFAMLLNAIEIPLEENMSSPKVQIPI